MKVLFSEIPDTGRSIEIRGDSWFPQYESVIVSSAKADVMLSPAEEGVTMDGDMQASINVVCDLCLETYWLKLVSAFKINFKCGDESEPLFDKEEHACSVDELDIVYLDKPVVDIHSILKQQILLTIPTKKICSKKCRGLCPHCGKNLNMSKCACVGDNEHSPFHILAKLKK